MNIAMDDHELLREFVHRRSEDAFSRLVERHLRMVLSTARRLLGDDQLAQDVTQNVFTLFAQKARGIKPPQVVGGWLYNTTRHVAMHAMRGERRRREREQAAAALQSHETHFDTSRVFEQLEPAMAELEAGDRDALVLRYLEDRSLREVGFELGISEDAARMRANRALEKLRAVLGQKGVSVTSVLLATVLVSGTGTAVPAGLASAITTAALAGTILTTATITTMNWINTKAVAAMVGAAVIAGTSTYLVKQNEVTRLLDENQKLTAQQATSTADAQAALNAVKSGQDELEKLKKDAGEVVRLRGEVVQLRKQRDSDRQLFMQELVRQKQAAAAPPPKSGGISITRDQLANAGYATPEAALQTITWATMSGNLSAEQIAEGLSPELLNDKEAYKEFEENRKESVSVFKSVDMLAKKTVDENKVEFKVALNVDLGPNAPAVPPSVMILPMTRVDGRWKLAGNPMECKQGWETEGQVQTFGR
jgi:RNA polymerase sigma factor (sigma-70 family)